MERVLGQQAAERHISTQQLTIGVLDSRQVP
jgi:hypothetical protein